MSESQTRTRSNTLFAGLLFAIFVAIYFPELAAYNLSIDEEQFAFRYMPLEFISMGRWGALVVETLLVPPPTMPYFPLAFFGVSLVATFLIIRLSPLWRGQGPLCARDALAFAIFAAFPVWYFVVEFFTLLVQTGVGLICCAMFAYLLGRALTGSRPPLSIIAAGLLGTLAIGIYQSFAFILVVLSGLSLLQLSRAGEFTIRRALIPAAALLLSAAGYLVIDRLARLITGAANSPYTDSIIDASAALANPAGGLWNVIRGALGTFGFDTTLYLYPAWGFAVLVTVGVVVAIANGRQWWWSAIAVLGVLAVPFGLHLLAGDKSIPTRSIIAAPFVAWGLTNLLLFNPPLWLVRAGMIVIGFSIFQSVYLFSSYQATSRVAAHYDYNLAADIHRRIIDENPGIGRPIYIDVHGGSWVFNPFPTPPTSTIGRGFFDWGEGEPRRIAAFMRLMGFTDIQMLPNERIPEFIGAYKDMPNWPAPGSLRIIDNVALIRLSDTPDTNHRQLLGQQP